MVRFVSQLNANGRHVLVGFAGGLPGCDLAMGLVMNFQKTISLQTFSLNTYAPQRLSSLPCTALRLDHACGSGCARNTPALRIASGDIVQIRTRDAVDRLNNWASRSCEVGH